MRMRFAGMQNDRAYKNLEENRTVDKRELFGKAFLIEDELESLEWKLTGERKQLLNYLVMEATTTIQDTVPVSAWFTPQIPLGHGPQAYSGLPGLILEVNQNDGRMVLTASDIVLEDIPDNMIVPPTKGKKVSREEFRQIRKEKMEEMRAQSGGRRGRMIIRGN